MPLICKEHLFTQERKSARAQERKSAGTLKVNTAVIQNYFTNNTFDLFQNINYKEPFNKNVFSLQFLPSSFKQKTNITSIYLPESIKYEQCTC